MASAEGDESMMLKFGVGEWKDLSHLVPLRLQISAQKSQYATPHDDLGTK